MRARHKTTSSFLHRGVECNHFAEKRKDIFGERNVMESFRFHLTLILLYLKECEFKIIIIIIIIIIVIRVFVIHFAQLFKLCL